MSQKLKVKVPKVLLENIDLLIKAGIYSGRNEAIRDAIRQNINGG